MSKEKFIDINDEIYAVEKFKKGMKLKKGIAYQKGDYVYPYMGNKLKDKKRNKAGIYKTKDDDYVIVKAVGKKAKKYHKDRIYKLDVSDIQEFISKEGLLTSDLDIILGESDDIFAPAITDNDNKLAVAIKMVLARKQIDLKNYVNRFQDATDMNNFKRSLLFHGKMAMEKFNKWCDVLDMEFEIIVRDKETSPNPIDEEIVIK